MTDMTPWDTDVNSPLEQRRRRVMEALNDDPGGLTHSIWAELGIDPQPPISAEELWLVGEAFRTGDWSRAETTKVWSKDASGRWTKIWSIPDSRRDEAGGVDGEEA